MNEQGNGDQLELDPELKRRLAEIREREDAAKRLQVRVNQERRFLIPILVFVLMLFPNFGRAKVVGASMEPQYKEGDALVILKSFRTFAPLKEGDVIVLRKMTGEYQGEEMVKRVAFIQNSQGNASPPQSLRLSRGNISFVQLFPYIAAGIQKVPPGMILVVGDNLAVSADSRDEAIGFVRDDEVIGKVLNR